MIRFVFRRVFWAVPVLLISSIIVFAAVRATTDPVKAAQRNPRTTAAALEKYKHDLGLDKSEPEQYWKWISHFALGDFGSSQHSNLPIWPGLRTALVNSLVLGLFSIFFPRCSGY